MSRLPPWSLAQVRLVMLYALRFEEDQLRTAQLKDYLVTAGIKERCARAAATRQARLHVAPRAPPHDRRAPHVARLERERCCAPTTPCRPPGAFAAPRFAPHLWLEAARSTRTLRTPAAAAAQGPAELCGH